MSTVIRERLNKLIEVEAYTINGEPTCAAMMSSGHEDGVMICQFFQTKRFGTIDICAVDGKEVERDGDFGRLLPHSNCIIWGSKYVS